MKRGLFSSILITNLLLLLIVACRITIAGETKHYFYFCIVGNDTLYTVTDTTGVTCIHPDSIDLGRVSGWIKAEGSIIVQGNDTLFLPDPPSDPRVTLYYVPDFIKINGHQQ